MILFCVKKIYFLCRKQMSNNFVNIYGNKMNAITLFDYYSLMELRVDFSGSQFMSFGLMNLIGEINPFC